MTPWIDKVEKASGGGRGRKQRRRRGSGSIRDAASGGAFALWKARMEPVVSAWVKQAPDGDKVLAAYRGALAQLGASY
jgi:prepilin signal peptidase PulO-like enzyme (type II secretory pathway)